MYDHDASRLVEVAGLKEALIAVRQADPIFDESWGLVAGWTVESRYLRYTSEDDARKLYAAIADRRHGVLRWIRRYW
jgi:hypothetical protein